jgi:hypothetical protein
MSRNEFPAYLTKNKKNAFLFVYWYAGFRNNFLVKL